jgi:anaerobic sulfite reductase subunit B
MNGGYGPEPYRVTGRRDETADTVTLTIEPAGQPVGPVRAGQFTMMYAFGVGEIPVSVSGSSADGCLTQTIRSVGAVTAALCDAPVGQLIGLRGPFGTSWDEQQATGGDLLLIAGGIGLAPLRPALLSALAERDRYRRVIVLAGARTPADLCFAAEHADWRAAGAEVLVTVDRADTGWTGNVGVVTQLFPAARLDPARTTALMCGPEVMMRISARALTAAGLAAGAIRVSLERAMQCGTAQCGHCQLGPLLLCRDGPVLSYAVAEPLLAVREL